MAKKKGGIVNIKLVSTADTGYFYVIQKNTRNITEKMSFRKYVEFKEQKLVYKA